jgi:hypothetical protein
LGFFALKRVALWDSPRPAPGPPPASDHAWEDLKEGLENSWEILKKGLTNAKTEFERGDTGKAGKIDS